MSSSLRSCPLVHAILSKFRQSFDMVQAQAGTRTRHAKLGAAVHTALAASKTFLSQEIDSIVNMYIHIYIYIHINYIYLITVFFERCKVLPAFDPLGPSPSGQRVNSDLPTV